MPATLQFECMGLFQFLPSTPTHPPRSTKISKDAAPNRINWAKDRDGHVSDVSCLLETDSTPTTLVPMPPTLSKAESATC